MSYRSRGTIAFNRQCGMKHKYPSQYIAKKALGKLISKSGEKWEDYNVYQCKMCCCWHYGHNKAYFKNLKKP